MSNGHRPLGGSALKTESERIHMIAAFREVGTFRGAAAMCGCDPKTIKRALAHRDNQPQSARRRGRTRNYGDRAGSQAGRVDRRPDLCSAPVVGGESRRLFGVGPQLPPAGSQGQVKLASRSAPQPAAQQCGRRVRAWPSFGASEQIHRLALVAPAWAVRFQCLVLYRVVWPGVCRYSCHLQS